MDRNFFRETFRRTTRASRLDSHARGRRRWQVHVFMVSCRFSWHTRIELLPHLSKHFFEHPNRRDILPAGLFCARLMSALFGTCLQVGVDVLPNTSWKDGRTPAPSSKKRRGRRRAPRRAHTARKWCRFLLVVPLAHDRRIWRLAQSSGNGDRNVLVAPALLEPQSFTLKQCGRPLLAERLPEP